jgi:hypothetical protein
MKAHRILIIALSAFYFGWKSGQKDKEKEIAGDDPCLIDVDGEMKKVPGVVCDIITESQSLLGRPWS